MNKKLNSNYWMKHLIGLGFLLIPLVVHPFYDDQYTNAKWGVLYGISFLLILSALWCAVRSPKKIRIPPFNEVGKKVRLLVFGIVSFYFLSIAFNWPGNYENQVLDWLSFLGIAGGAYHLFSETESAEETWVTIFRYNAISTFLVILYGALQYLQLDPFPFLEKSEIPSSFFGFQNMTAEFVGLSIILQVYWIYTRHMAKEHLTSSWVLLVFSSVFMCSLLCRSVFLSLALASVPLFFLSWKKRLQWVPVTVCLISFSVLLPFQRWVSSIPISGVISSTISGISSGIGSRELAAQIARKSASGHEATQGATSLTVMDRIKEGNVHLRWVRWKNTLAMIRSHFWGVGPGNYEFEYIPFAAAYERDAEVTEENLVRSPHNGFLQIAAQSGVLVFITSLICLGFIAFAFFHQIIAHSQAKKARRDQILLFASVLLFILIDALFAFPMDNAYPFYFVAVFSGLALQRGVLVIGARKKRDSLRSKGQGFPLLDHLKRAILGLLFVLVGYFSLMFHLSQTVEVLFSDDYSKVSFACGHFPSNWRVCVRKAMMELEKQEFSKLEDSSRSILKSSPHNFFAIRLLADALMYQGKVEEGCRALGAYDALFQSQSSVRRLYLENCKF